MKNRRKREFKRFFWTWFNIALILEIVHFVYAIWLVVDEMPLMGDSFKDRFLYWYPHGPLNYLGLAGTALVISTPIWYSQYRKRTERQYEECDMCGYSYDGIGDAEVCPECGERISAVVHVTNRDQDSTES